MTIFGDSLNYYRFQSHWILDASYEDLLSVLQDLSSYPLWWPEIKEVNTVDASTALVRIRALLPYSLNLIMRQVLVDGANGVLRAELRGDLDGWSQWTLTPLRHGCSLTFDEEVIVKKPLMRLFGPAARPLFCLNHAVMMRNCKNGLTGFAQGRNLKKSRQSVDSGVP